MTTPIYTCPLTGQQYPQETMVYFRINGENRAAERKGVLLRDGDGKWKVLAKIGGQGEILRIAAEGRAAAPQSIRRA